MLQHPRTLFSTSSRCYFHGWMTNKRTYMVETTTMGYCFPTRSSPGMLSKSMPFLDTPSLSSSLLSFPCSSLTFGFAAAFRTVSISPERGPTTKRKWWLSAACKCPGSSVLSTQKYLVGFGGILVYTYIYKYIYLYIEYHLVSVLVVDPPLPYFSHNSAKGREGHSLGTYRKYRRGRQELFVLQKNPYPVLES